MTACVLQNVSPATHTHKLICHVIIPQSRQSTGQCSKVLTTTHFCMYFCFLNLSCEDILNLFLAMDTNYVMKTQHVMYNDKEGYVFWFWSSGELANSFCLETPCQALLGCLCGIFGLSLSGHTGTTCTQTGQKRNDQASHTEYARYKVQHNNVCYYHLISMLRYKHKMCFVQNLLLIKAREDSCVEACQAKGVTWERLIVFSGWNVLEYTVIIMKMTLSNSVTVFTSCDHGQQELKQWDVLDMIFNPILV